MLIAFGNTWDNFIYFLYEFQSILTLWSQAKQTLAKLMLCCEVLKAADMIVVTTLLDHLHFYFIHLIKARVTTKEKV